MIPNADNEKVIRRYLLGDLAQDDLTRVEIRLLEDAEFAAQVQLVEGELLEEYLDSALTASEHAQCEAHFLAAPPRQRQLAVARALRRYAAQASEIELKQTAPPFTAAVKRWWATLLQPSWGWAVAVVFMLAVGWGVWRMQVAPSQVEIGLQAMAQAYRGQRPLEARITGFAYAPFPKTLGNEHGNSDYLALDRAERILLDAVTERPSVEALHALGQLYLARKKFVQAEEVLRRALQAAPANARLQNDLGVLLYEKWERERSTGPTAASEDLKRQSLEHLERALTLDGSLREARFNLALLYQAAGQSQRARIEWEKYLTSEPDARAKQEAERNLELLK